jgi:hypothetical protein
LFVERGRADQHGHPTAVLAEVFLLRRWQAPGCLQPFDGPRIEIAPFRRGQVRPAHATGDEILTVVAHHAKKGVIGLDDPTFEFPEVDADDVGVDQTSDLGLALFEIAV